MKKIFPSLPFHVLPLIGMLASAGAEQKPEGSVAISAEVWSFEIPEGVSTKAVFEQWRAQHPPGEPEVLALDGLAIPAREASTMVRVAGVLTAPLTGYYAFSIHAPAEKGFLHSDKTELWIHDGRTEEWRLAQCTGNPIKSGERTLLEAGVPRRFELWTMGRNRIVVDWEVVEFGMIDPATGKNMVKLARQMVPASAMGLRTAAPDDKLGDGLLDSWQKRHGLDLNDGIGPKGP